MQSVDRITQQSALPPRNEPAQPAARGGTPASAAPTPADQVEISFAAAEAAPALGAADDAALAGRLAAIRAEIAAGAYITPEKLEVVVERLWAELRAAERP